MIMPILYAVLALSIMGLLFGITLAFASKIFAVEKDERIPQIQEVLTGANCGGCGYAGCSAFATAVAEGRAKINGCPVGGTKVAAKVAAIMGTEEIAEERKNAFVRCAGSANSAIKKYEYKGEHDCNAVMRLGGGDKMCKYACIGFGTCVKACSFGALKIENGVAVVDKEKCTACGLCISSCPKNLITLTPYDSAYAVACSSLDKGPAVRKQCSVGCISCRICEKACEFGAIAIINNVAQIDFEKCTGCGVCAEKCPSKIIHCNN
ncbi:MAG: RnfABCDGE type electron transport complex subunit B [Bacillota bacterium]|nr:RnfABCDGE type electron transport complex subunit B [Bacillota bacterium]